MNYPAASCEEFVRLKQNTMPANKENQHKFEDEEGRIIDKNLAEGMAYAEKPYRDESIRRKKIKLSTIILCPGRN